MQTFYVWDGGNMVLEYEATDSENLIADYKKFYAYGADGLAYRKDIDGSVYTYNTNYRGDVLSVMDDGRNIKAEYMYDAYGNLVDSNVAAGFSDNFGYRGEYTDPESGYIYLRNRYFDPKTGRFLTEDPIRDGLNWFAYCDGNPVKYTDPWGLGPGDYFLCPDDAAIDFGMNYNQKSMDKNREFASAIEKIEINGAIFYTYTKPNIGGAPRDVEGGRKWSVIIPNTEKRVGAIHTHVENPGIPSDDDINSRDFKKLNYYYITGGEGFVKRFWWNEKKQSAYKVDSELIYNLLPRKDYGKGYKSNVWGLSSMEDIEKNYNKYFNEYYPDYKRTVDKLVGFFETYPGEEVTQEPLIITLGRFILELD